MGWLAWAAFLPWILYLEECSSGQAFLGGWLTGLLFFAGTVWWVGEVSIPGAIVLVAYLALFFAAWAWFAHRALRREGPLFSLLLLPASWVALEYARSHLLSGFGWNLLGHTQWNWIPILQIADLTGVWGVSFLVVLANTAFCHLLQREKGRGICLLLTLLCLGGAAAYGMLTLRRMDAVPPARTSTVALLQGDIPQARKWDASFGEATWKRYEELVAEAVKRRPELIVWPETAVPDFLEETPVADRLGKIARSAGSQMLVGIPTGDSPDGSPRNSAVLFGTAGEQEGLYSKIHLVPFGEFIPLKPLFSWLENFYPIADFSPGERFTVFRTRPPAGVLICFEDLFPELGRRFVGEGAGLLLVITNDGWFGRSAASLQHLQASVFRAVENRVWVARAANTGWTGFVDSAGRRLPKPGRVPRFIGGVATAEVPAAVAPPTLYNRWGDWFPLLCLFLSTAWGIIKLYDGDIRSA